MNQFISNKNLGSAGSELGYQDFERLNESPEIQQAIAEEFGSALQDGAESGDGFSRRHWLQIMGASLALGAAGCRYQPEQIVPYAFRPQNRTPGATVRYASMIDFAGAAHPIEALSFDGRPIKLDGNRLHEQTRNLSEKSPGPSSVFTQARVLELYDPDRLRTPLARENTRLVESNWNDFLAAFRVVMGQKDLSSVALLAEPSASPSMKRLQQEFVARGGHLHFFTPVLDDQAREGSKLAFGQVVRPLYELDKARVIVCLDADPLLMDGGAIRNNRLFAAGRDVDHSPTMSRLYCVESDYSVTGASADHRMSLPSSKIASFLGALAAEIGQRKAGESVNKSLKYREKLLAAMAQDLVDNAGSGVIIVGERQPAAVHAAAHKLNEQLGNIGKTVSYISPIDAERPQLLASVQELKSKLESGAVKSLVIVGGNPVFDAPRDLGLDGLLQKIPNTFHLSYYRNETSNLCQWVFNLSHPLEAWGDGLAFDGSWCLAQPLISPLFSGRSALETLASGMGEVDVDGQAYVQATAKEKFGEADFDRKWRQSLHDGFFAESAAQPVSVTAQAVALPANDGAWLQDWSGEGPSLEMVFLTSRAVYDGRFANSAWLQELPDFVTKITWDNAALVSPETAKQLGLKQDMKYVFSVNGKQIQLPVHIQPGQAKGSIGVAIGYGRKAAGAVGGDESRKISVGFDVGPLRSSSQWYFCNGVEVQATSGTSYPLAVIQANWEIDSTGREEIQRRMFMNEKGERSALLREGSLKSYQHFLEKHGGDHKPHALQKTTALPIISNVSHETIADEPRDEHAAGHGHEEHHGWPTAFHEHELFDLTPGVRESYRADRPDMKNAWGMSIDLNKCTGCNACVVACQAENNIPIVGKWQVFRGREMHWIRLDTYFGNNLYNAEAAASDDKQLIHQPVACHHCENAPCETVCPVAATVHSSEGLNDMVYNRCIGTRYCGNNCPYKVRRFNYLNYSDAVTFVKYPAQYVDRLSAGDRALQNLVMNPEVTIRTRGVMEKCTYCVQRIQNTKILAKSQGNRSIGPNEITTACQDVCPSGAIKFGDLTQADSDVRHAHKNPRAYAMLSELNNIPRTKYLARVRNPHPALMDMDDRGVQSDQADDTLPPNIEIDG